eukprot:3899647-Heterocapsa_arctica.AAC.1
MYVPPSNKGAPFVHKQPPPHRPLMPAYILNAPVAPQRPWCVTHQWTGAPEVCEQGAAIVVWHNRYGDYPANPMRYHGVD